MDLLQNVRHSARMLRARPGFAALIIALFGAGIGINTAMFSVVDGVLLRPLPYDHAERIVVLTTRNTRTGALSTRMTGPDFVDIRENARVFDALTFYAGGEFGVRSGQQSEFARTYWVSPDYFRVFGMDAARGRTFTDDDADRGAVVGFAFAARAFGSAEAALGQVLTVENRPYKIVGVTPPAFQFPPKAEVWLSWPQRPESMERTAFNYRALGRLKPGVNVDSGQAAVGAIGQRLAAAYPAANRQKGLGIAPLRDLMVGQVRTTLYILMGAVALVLLVVCANIANLSLARAATRARETAVRAALGASRGRILGERMTESLLLGIAGGALGLLIAYACLNAFLRLAPPNIPRLSEISLDATVLAFCAGASLLACVFAAVVPAWQASRLDLSDTLKQGGTRGLLGGGSNRVRHALVIAEIALSFVLVTGAVFLFRSFVALNTAELGFRTENILVMYAHAPARGLEQFLRTSRAFEDLFARLRTIPGITSVAGAMGVPAGQYGSEGQYAVEGKHVFGAGQNLPAAGFRLASAGYFNTMGIPLLRGREFTPGDGYEAPFVAIISAALAKQTFANEDPLGRRIRCGFDSDKWMTVVGVVGDVRQESPASPPAPELYMPLQQHPYHANEMQVVMRTALDPVSFTSAARDATRAVYPAASTKFTTMQAMVSDSISAPRFRTFLITAFASVALLLAMGGVFGLMSYVAAERTSEFGLRIALGAVPGDVMRLVLLRALTLAAVGLALGVVAFLALRRLLETLLFGLSSTDPVTYIGVLAAIALTTLAATLAPAWQSTRVDPMTALRQ